MFDLNSPQSKTPSKKEALSFDLETALNSAQKLQEYERHIRQRLEKLKSIPAASLPPSQTNPLAIMRNGYEALLKVMERTYSFNQTKRG